MMDTVYRIQNKKNIGPYYKNSSNEDKKEIMDMVRIHNKSHFKPKMDSIPGQLCAFSSLTQLNMWFSQSEISMLKRYDYFIYEVKKVNIVKKDSFQVLFEKCEGWNEKDQKKLN